VAVPSEVPQLSCEAPVSVLGGVQEPELGKELRVLHLTPVEAAERRENQTKQPGCFRALGEGFSWR